MALENNKKLWSGRFSENSAELLEKFNNSLDFDKRLFRYDIEGSVAHVKMLSHCKIISLHESEEIIRGLNKILLEIEEDKDWFEKNKAEDIHTAIENRLCNLIGDTGKKLHTGRSRNDQVATDIRLYLKYETNLVILLIKNLKDVFISLAKKYHSAILPGYTHLQQAMPITLGHYFLAYEQKLSRDVERLIQTFERIDVLPLGSGALSGIGFEVDRHFTAQVLGFKKISENSLDAVSDRDFLAECLFNISLLSVHLSQFAEEMIIWNTEEFKFITISDAYATGSSMMPQKKNPDIPELIRGKTGRHIGNLMAILTILKALPLAYNKDLQEDKERLFDSIDNIKITLEVVTEFLENIDFNTEKMYKVASNSFLNATDVADYLTKKGVPFRIAHEVVGKIVAYCIERNRLLSDLSMSEWNSFHKLFGDDIIEKIKIESCVSEKNIYGGTSPNQILSAIARAEEKSFNE